MLTRLSGLGAMLLCGGVAAAATTLHLPPWVCNGSGTLFRAGFQDAEGVPVDPSAGTGGDFPGQQTRQVSVPGLAGGIHNYYLSIPANYDPLRSWPLLVALHGTAPDAASYAQGALASWSSALFGKGVIVVAPIASNGSSWLTPGSVNPSDYDMFDAVIADVEAHYNIERTRRYLWGFSAGAHVAHDLVINGASASLNVGTLAGYSVSAGRLFSLACLGLSEAGCGARLAALARRIPLDIHLGNSDPLAGDPYYAGLDKQRFIDNGWVLGQTLWYVPFVGGHTYTVSQLGVIWTNLCPFAVEP